jgi:hypothetical protein
MICRRHPLVFGEMPVEGVELVERHQVDVLLDELERHEVAADVEVHAAVAKARRVLDRDCREYARPVHANWKQLPERLEAVEQPCIGGRANVHTIRCDRETVALGIRGSAAVATQADGGSGDVVHADRQCPTYHGGGGAAPRIGCRVQIRARIRWNHDGRELAEAQLARAALDGNRQRHDGR